MSYWNDFGMYIFYKISSFQIHQFFLSKQTHMNTKVYVLINNVYSQQA